MNRKGAKSKEPVLPHRQEEAESVSSPGEASIYSPEEESIHSPEEESLYSPEEESIHSPQKGVNPLS